MISNEKVYGVKVFNKLLRNVTSFERGCTMVNIKGMTPELVKELTFTKEELQELERARAREIVFDEDCPETTPEKALKFRRVNPPRGTTQRA